MSSAYLTGRDKRIYEFLEKFKAATTLQIYRMFFKGLKQGERIARRRLAAMMRVLELKRSVEPYSGRLIYYIGSSVQLLHRILITEFYCRLREEDGQIDRFDLEYSLGRVRSDAFAAFVKGDSVYLFLIEAHKSNYALDLEKYEALRGTRSYMPKIVIISDREHKSDSKLDWVRLKSDFSNWKEIFA